MTDIHIDDDSIPVVVGLEPVPPKSNHNASWLTVILMGVAFTMLGFMCGWTLGYMQGVNEAQAIVEEVIDKVSDGLIVEGQMPW